MPLPPATPPAVVAPAPQVPDRVAEALSRCAPIAAPAAGGIDIRGLLSWQDGSEQLIVGTPSASSSVSALTGAGVIQINLEGGLDPRGNLFLQTPDGRMVATSPKDGIEDAPGALGAADPRTQNMANLVQAVRRAVVHLSELSQGAEHGGAILVWNAASNCQQTADGRLVGLAPGQLALLAADQAKGVHTMIIPPPGQAPEAPGAAVVPRVYVYESREERWVDMGPYALESSKLAPEEREQLLVAQLGENTFWNLAIGAFLNSAENPRAAELFKSLPTLKLHWQEYEAFVRSENMKNPDLRRPATNADFARNLVNQRRDGRLPQVPPLQKVPAGCGPARYAQEPEVDPDDLARPAKPQKPGAAPKPQKMVNYLPGDALVVAAPIVSQTNDPLPNVSDLPESCQQLEDECRLFRDPAQEGTIVDRVYHWSHDPGVQGLFMRHVTNEQCGARARACRAALVNQGRWPGD